MTSEKPTAYCAIGEKSLAMFTLRFKGEEYGEMHESQFIKPGEILLCSPGVFKLPPFENDEPRYGRPGEFMLGEIGRLTSLPHLALDFFLYPSLFLNGGIN